MTAVPPAGIEQQFNFHERYLQFVLSRFPTYLYSGPFVFGCAGSYEGDTFE